jgi:NAD(P)H-hydrate epimerase
LVYIATPESTAYAISSLSPDLITIKLEGTHLNPDNMPTLKPYVEIVDVVAIGPGLGLHPETKRTVKLIVELAEKAEKPILLDADGLKAFAGFRRPLKTSVVLTPHAGEYATLAGNKPSIDLSKRTVEVDKSAAKLNAVILLKGAVDIISNGQRHKLNFTGNPGMTVGGTGDVLSGIVAAFLAQDIDPFESAVAGAFVNGAAGDFVYQEKGYHMSASDLIQWIPPILDDPMSHLQVRKPFARPS